MLFGTRSQAHAYNPSDYMETRLKLRYCADFKEIRYESTTLKRIAADKSHRVIVRLQLHGAIYRPDSFVMMLRYCAYLKAIRYESTSLNRIVADKSHRVIVA